MALKGINVVHAVPGRVRLKVDKVKGDPAFAQKAQDKLGQVPGIERVEAKPATGSVLIYYSLAELLGPGALVALTDGFSELFPEIEADTISLGLESLVTQLASGENPNPAGHLVGSLAAVNAKITQFTGGVDLKFLVPMTLLFFGVRSLWSSEKLPFPSWYDYLWFAFASFTMLNRGLVEGSQAPHLAEEKGRSK